MDVNFDEAESSFVKFDAGKRYDLVIESAAGGENDNGTPFLKLVLQTSEGIKAHEHMMYLTPKALYRAQEWFKAMGLGDSGKVSFEPENLAGIRLSAECYLEPYTVNKGTSEEKTYQSTKWCKPQRIAIGAAPRQAAPAPKPAAASYVPPRMVDETVPF